MARSVRAEKKTVCTSLRRILLILRAIWHAAHVGCFACFVVKIVGLEPDAVWCMALRGWLRQAWRKSGSQAGLRLRGCTASTRRPAPPTRGACLTTARMRAAGHWKHVDIGVDALQQRDAGADGCMFACVLCLERNLTFNNSAEKGWIMARHLPAMR